MRNNLPPDKTTTINTTTASNDAVEPIPISFEFAQGDTLSLAAIEAGKAMAAVLEQQPELCRTGFYHFERHSKQTLAEYQAFFEAERARMLEPLQLCQFMVARAWLDRFPKSRRFYPDWGATGLNISANKKQSFISPTGRLSLLR
jgi:hypothetical protein